jgi:hypothetical protein
MNSRVVEKTTTCAKAVFAIFSAALALCGSASVAFAQEPIRVQTNQVLVPVFVWDKKSFRDYLRNPKKLQQALLAGNTELRRKRGGGDKAAANRRRRERLVVAGGELREGVGCGFFEAG